MPFSPASFLTAEVALTSERSGRSAVAVEEADGDEDDMAEGDAALCAGCGGTDSDVAAEGPSGADAAGPDREGAEGVGSDGS